MKIMRIMPVAVATIALLGALPAKVFASDAEYLQALEEIVGNLPLIQNVTDQLGSSNNIVMAKGVCSVLDKPDVTTVRHLVLGVIQEDFFDLPAPRLPDNDDDRATAIGGYIAVTAIAGSKTYCNQHVQKVNDMFANATDR